MAIITFCPRANFFLILLNSFAYDGVGYTLGAKNLRRAIPRGRRIPKRHAQFIRN